MGETLHAERLVTWTQAAPPVAPATGMRLAVSRAQPGEWRRLALGSALALLAGSALALAPAPPPENTPPPETTDLQWVSLPASALMPAQPEFQPVPPPEAAAAARPEAADPVPPEAETASAAPVLAEPLQTTAPVVPTPPTPQALAEPAPHAAPPRTPGPVQPKRPAIAHATVKAPAAPPTIQQAVAPPSSAAPAPSAVAAAAAAASPGELSAFSAGMRRAVRDALIYPPAARMAGQKGEVKVAFNFMDGTASDVALAKPSGLPLLDQAALATVRSARYGAPPPGLAHRTLHLTILVQFDPDRPG